MTRKSRQEYNDFVDGERLRDHDQAPAPQHQQDKSKDGPKKPPLTHFVCLPLVTDDNYAQLQAGLDALTQDVTSSGLLPPKAVRPPGTLHLTLGVMSLDDEQLERAKHCLHALNPARLLRDLSARAIAEQAAENGTVAENLNAAALSLPATADMETLVVQIKGLVPMHAPHKTSILYAEPADDSHRLYPFAVALRDYFARHKLLVNDARPLKLHATMINTIYAKPRGHGHSHSHSHGHGPKARGSLQVDARDLIDRYSSVVWAANVPVDRIRICRMGAKKILGADGDVVGEEYEVVAEAGMNAA